MSELRVFAQSADTPIDIDAWSAHAVRFFGTKLGFAELPSHPAPLAFKLQRGEPTLRTRFVVAPLAAPPGIRSATRRPCDERDFADAEIAEAASGTSGLALLARRCGALWIIEREGAEDALALRFAAIVASLVLGPILDPDATALFGVKTAREKLSAMG